MLGVPGHRDLVRGQRSGSHGDATATLLVRPGAAHHRAASDFPADTLLNINLPPVHASEVKGIKVTKLGSRYFSESLTRDEGSVGPGDLLDRRRAPSPGPAARTPTIQAVQDGYISVTPLHMDLTNYASSRRCGDGRWRARAAGRQLRRLSQPPGRDAAATRASATSRVLRAVAQVPRHRFVPESVRHRAYEDCGAADRRRARRSRSHRCRRGTSRCCGSPGKEKRAGGRHRVGLPDGAAGRCWPSTVFSVERVPGLASARARRRCESVGHHERHRAGGRRHPGLAGLRAVRRHPGGGGLTRRAGAAAGTARPRRTAGDPDRRPGEAGPAPWSTRRDGRAVRHHHARRRALRAAASANTDFAARAPWRTGWSSCSRPSTSSCISTATSPRSSSQYGDLDLRSSCSSSSSARPGWW